MTTRRAPRRLLFALTAALAAMAGLSPAVTAGGSGGSGGRAGSVVAATGVSATNPDLVVEVLVAVQAGQTADQAVANALAAQGARPFTSAELSDGFAFTGLEWPATGATGEHQVAQVYSAFGSESSLDPQDPAEVPNLLTEAQRRWTDVQESNFVFSATRNDNVRCGSLIRECDRKQLSDGVNWVGWVALKDRFTLGVTWYDRANVEADVALNTKFTWVDDCAADSSKIDALSVLIHELGHVVGLDHSSDQNSVMSTPYNGAQCDLGHDDEQAITLLYPAAVVALSGVVTNSETGALVQGAVVTLPEVGLSATTDEAGHYEIQGIAGHLTYDVSVSATDYLTFAEKDSVYLGGVNRDDGDFALREGTTDTTDTGGTGGPPKCVPKWACP